MRGDYPYSLSSWPQVGTGQRPPIGRNASWYATRESFVRSAIRSWRAEIPSGLRSGAAIALRNHAADNTVKVTAVPLALVVYLTLGGVYSPLRPAVVRQKKINLRSSRHLGIYLVLGRL